MTIDQLLQRLAADDDSAMDELLSHVCDRMRRLTRKMLRDYPRLRDFEQTDDVFNNALLRLCRCVRETRPTSEQAFFRLAALNIRRELIDLTRHYSGPMGLGTHVVSIAEENATVQLDLWNPERLARWREFHEQVERLPDESRELIDLLIYHGRTQVAVAAQLGVTPRTVQYRWAAAMRLLYEALGGEMPE